jgi:CubicO group peptidase (beta-lactamase class C family)
MSKIFSRSLISYLLVLSIFTLSLPLTGYAQTAPAAVQTGSAGYPKALAAIEEKAEARRKELGIPGMALVIVHDGRVIYSKGLGYKDFEKKVPVTPNTQFAIGSATKAFTALSVLMSQDEGKVSLDDSPKKYLTYFKMKDPDTDKNITVRDLMDHSSGLNRTDLAMITGKLNRAELIQTVGEAKPMAKLREKFFYQNIMFAAAGEIVATVQKMPWEQFVPQRIFKPLGMTNSTMSMKDMEKAKDYSFGYEYNFDTKATRRLPFRDIDQVAPAGSINSSANDMAKWLEFVLGGGAAAGKRLVSEKGYEEWLKPQMRIGGKSSYGLGWFLQEWNGMKVVQHGGNIDGFNAMVAMIPEKKLGFVMLTNVTGSPLAGEMMPIVWKNILGDPAAAVTAEGPPRAVSLENEVGKYRFEAAGFDIEVKMQDGKLVAIVPDQPVYTLENVKGRKYKLTGAPDGFFMTFTDKDAYLEQPQGNYTLPKAESSVKKELRDAYKKGMNPAQELLGKYQTPSGKMTVEIAENGSKVELLVTGQQPYELKERSLDVFNTLPLPDTYSLKVRRAADGKLEGLTMSQPEGEFPLNYLGPGDKSAKPKMTADEIMAKTVDALGGAEALKASTSRQIKFEIDFENQGVKGSGTSYARAPNMAANDTTLTAAGKQIASVRDYFDGTGGGESYSFADTDTYAGQRLEDVKLQSDFYGWLNWKNGLKSADVKGTEKVGDEDVYVITAHYEKASDITYYISTKTFLPLKIATLIVSSTSSQKTPSVQVLSDYRMVDGVMTAFKSTAENPGMGTIVTYIKEVKNNVTIPDAVFKPKP